MDAKTADNRGGQTLSLAETQNDPSEAWKTLSLEQLAEKERCSQSMVSRNLPKAVAKLKEVSLNEAEKLVDDVMNVRRCRLLDWEIEIIEHLCKKDPSVSMFRLSFKQY